MPQDSATRRPERVDQLLGAFRVGDATGNEALTIRSLLQAAGFKSEIFAGHIAEGAPMHVRALSEHRTISSTDNLCLFHFAAGSPVARYIYHAPDRVALVYHNITPAEFFAAWSPELARLSHLGRRELVAFRDRCTVALAKSEFSRRELVELGFERTDVLPFLIDLSRRPEGGSPVVRRLYGDGRVNILSVGRIVPNKRIEDLLRAFAAFRLREPRSRLLLVGDHRGQERYLDSLLQLASALRLNDVVFTGHVTESELESYYSVAAAYLGLSEHEGYGVPLVEAMAHGLPVVAFNAGAVAETLGGGGVLLGDKDAAHAATALKAVIEERDTRAAVLKAQAAVVQRLRSRDLGQLLANALAPVLGSGL
jgi:L-malate glycosyltransferase